MGNKYTVGDRFRNETNGLVCVIVSIGSLGYKIHAQDGSPPNITNTEYFSEEEINKFLRRGMYTKIEPF